MKGEESVYFWTRKKDHTCRHTYTHIQTFTHIHTHAHTQHARTCTRTQAAEGRARAEAEAVRQEDLRKQDLEKGIRRAEGIKGLERFEEGEHGKGNETSRTYRGT